MKNKHLTIRDLKKLRVSSIAIEVVKKIDLIIESLPFEENHIKDQLTRASSSIVLNISRGEQLYFGYKCKSYSDAIGSAQECKSWLLIIYNKKLISDGEFFSLESMIDSIIKILKRIIENLENNHTEKKNSSLELKDVKDLRCFQLAQTLVMELYYLPDEDFSEMNRYIKEQLINVASNLASHISEGEQLYSGNKIKFLNNAFQESNVVKTYLEIIKEKIEENSKYEELKKIITEIQHLLSTELKNLDSSIKCFI